MSSFWLAAFTACIWGVVPLLEKIGLSRVSPMVGLFYRCVGVLIGFIFLAIFFVKPGEIRSADPRSVVFIMLGGFLASFAAQILFYNALKIGEVSRTVLISGSYPFITFLLGVLIFSESITALKIVGAVLIAAGLIFLKLG